MIPTVGEARPQFPFPAQTSREILELKKEFDEALTEGEKQAICSDLLRLAPKATGFHADLQALARSNDKARDILKILVDCQKSSAI